jgi:hypothetical protein
MSLADAESGRFGRRGRSGRQRADEMPINAVGKVDRVALMQMADAAANRHLA